MKELTPKQKYQKEYYQNNKIKKLTTSKEYYEDNKESISEGRKKYYKNNKDKFKDKSKQYYKDNKDIILNKIKKYQTSNINLIKEYQKNWYILNKESLKLKYSINKERILKYQNQYAKNNKVKIKEYMRIYNYDRRRIDVSFKLGINLRCRLNIALKNNPKNSSMFNLLGVDIEEFKVCISNLFRPEMNWENYGDIWELDHILPCSSFDLTQECQVKECFNYKNYQPLFKTTEIAKRFGYTNEIGNRNKHKNLI